MRKTKILTTAAIKGGTGKTTTAAALAQAGVYDGKRILAVDLDPQANLTFFLSGDPRKAGACQLIMEGAAAVDVIQRTDQGADVIAANMDLAAAKTEPGSARRLQAALEPIKKKYDLIVIDTPPQLGELTYNALQAATDVLVPLEADTASLQGLYLTLDLAEHIRTNSNHGLRIAGVVVTRYDARSKLARYMLDTIRRTGEDIGAPLLGTTRQAVAVKEAQAFQASLYEHAPKCTAAGDYMALYKALTA